MVNVNPERFANLATRVFHVDASGKSTEELARIAIEKVREFFRSIGAPTRLADYDIGSENIDRMAEQAVRFKPIGNFTFLGKDDVKQILEASL